MNRLFFTLLAGVAATPAFAFQLIVNGGFETGQLDPWAQTLDLGGPEDWRVTTSDRVGGQYSATARGNKMLYQSVRPTAGRAIVSAGFFLKNSDATFNAYRWYYSDQTYSEFYAKSRDTNWAYYDILPTLNRNKTVVGLGIFGVNGGVTFRTWIDDVSILAVRPGTMRLDPVPEPTTLIALGVGLIAVRLRRR